MSGKHFRTAISVKLAAEAGLGSFSGWSNSTVCKVGFGAPGSQLGFLGRGGSAVRTEVERGGRKEVESWLKGIGGAGKTVRGAARRDGRDGGRGNQGGGFRRKAGRRETESEAGCRGNERDLRERRDPDQAGFDG